MFRKLFLFTLSALLMLTGVPLACAEDDFSDDLTIENVPPEEPVVTEDEFIRITAEYLTDSDLTRYTAQLINDPTFPDGSALTAKDLLFSLYVYIDPACPLAAPGDAFSSVPGLESYQRQISADRLNSAAETMSAIAAAGADHVWSEADGWTHELQAAYWQLHSEYTTACEAEFPNCAQAIVDSCSTMLESDVRGAFDLSSAEISADEGLRVAYAMQQWGYASAVGSVLTAKHSGTTWSLDSTKPTVQDFANELSLAYDGDLGACWAIESCGTYSPTLPNLEQQFTALLLGDTKDSVSSVSGIRMTDENTLEIDLPGIDMHSAGRLFGQPALSLEHLGDADQWSPEDGLYGHAFGDLSVLGDTESITSAIQSAPTLLKFDDEIIF